MTATELIVALLVGVALVELVEHVLLPLIFALKGRKLPPTTGPEAMAGKVVEVRQWAETGGHVFVDGALWKAVSESRLARGDRAVVRSVNGLTLWVEPDSGDAVTHRPTRTARAGPSAVGHCSVGALS